MYLINHFLDVLVPLGNNNDITEPAPDVKDADQTNSVASLGGQADLCASMYGKYPNFMLVDVSFIPPLFDLFKRVPV